MPKHSPQSTTLASPEYLAVVKFKNKLKKYNKFDSLKVYKQKKPCVCVKLKKYYFSVKNTK